MTPPGAGEAQPLTARLRKALESAEYAGRDLNDLALAYNVLSEAVTNAIRTLDAARVTQTAGLREALATALSVALHEFFDPDCTGEPTYDETQRLANGVRDTVMAMPVLRAALATTSAGDADGHESWCPVAVLLAKDKPVCQCRSRAASVDDEGKPVYGFCDYCGGTGHPDSDHDE